MTTRISHELYVEGHQCYKEIVAHLPDSVSLHWSIQPLTQAAVAAGKDRGGNILGLENVSQSCKNLFDIYPLYLEHKHYKRS